MTEDGKYGDRCFHDNTSAAMTTVAMDTPIISFPGSQLIEADNFTFTLTVSAPNRNKHSSFQVIHVAKQDMQMAK